MCLLVVGTWARLEKAPAGSLDNMSTDPVLLLLALGVVMCSISLLGCVGSLRENICLLKVVRYIRVIAVIQLVIISSYSAVIEVLVISSRGDIGGGVIPRVIQRVGLYRV